MDRGHEQFAFNNDRKTIRAVERALEITIEATTKFDDDIKLQLGDHPWDLIKGMGNRFRHAYDKVDLEVVWDVATNKLPALAADCRRVLSEIDSA